MVWIGDGGRRGICLGRSTELGKGMIAGTARTGARGIAQAGAWAGGRARTVGGEGVHAVAGRSANVGCGHTVPSCRATCQKAPQITARTAEPSNSSPHPQRLTPSTTPTGSTISRPHLLGADSVYRPPRMCPACLGRAKAPLAPAAPPLRLRLPLPPLCAPRACTSHNARIQKMRQKIANIQTRIAIHEP